MNYRETVSSMEGSCKNILDMQSRTADKGWSYSLLRVTEGSQKPPTWTDSLLKDMKRWWAFVNVVMKLP
jgi:hypothetical protein